MPKYSDLKKALFLPEASDYIAESTEQGLELAQPIDGEFVSGIKQACKQFGIYVSIGVHERIVPRTYNTHLLIDGNGEIKGLYRKLHLFDVSVPNGPILMESKSTEPGSVIVKPINTPFGRVGLGVCYDLRFPEFSTLLQKQGMDIMTYPSAFTVKTGLAHWEILLRARAIETQSYVVAAAQYGHHTSNRESYGHAMIVDPWGKILATCTPTEPIQAVEIDLDYLKTIRTNMPVVHHRRDDVYTLEINEEN
jgi:predicted amidohydrolase